MAKASDRAVRHCTLQKTSPKKPSSPASNLNDLLTIDEAAALRRSSRATTYRDIADGILPAIRIGERRIRIRRRDALRGIL